MLKNIKNYLIDNKFKITILDNNVNLLNYNKIINIQNNIITIESNGKNVYIKGDNLYVKKLLDNELLIVGDIKKIELE